MPVSKIPKRFDNNIDEILPSQTGNNAKVLGTNGTTASWVTAGGSASAVLYTTQTLTTGEALQACTNLAIGDPDTDFLTYYNNA